MAEPSSGSSKTLTFLFTDIEGSTRRWESEREAMALVLARHDALLRETIEGHHGQVFKTVGDAFCTVFASAADAAAAAAAVQRTLAAESWEVFGSRFSDLRVRMAIHTGEAETRDDDFFGPTVNRVARLLAVTHGGQVLVSSASESVMGGHLPAGLALRDLGEHRLKDLDRAERIWQLTGDGLIAEFPPLRSLDARPNNLPLVGSSFIGRERELADLRQRMDSGRLITVTGPGGAGKTRLALEAAADASYGFPDGVWFIDLASLDDGRLIPQAVATVLGLREGAGQGIEATLWNWMKGRRLLLVLDNCEHVLVDSAGFVTSMMSRCPGVHVLATSREPLMVSGELSWPLAMMDLPVRRRRWKEPDLAQLAMTPAVRLFIARAQAARLDFAVDPRNASSVAELCWRLDGIPLALELAAARVRAMSVDQILTRLDDRFRILTGGSRSALPRQQTLRAAIDWSYELLSDGEKQLLRRLAVFRGGWQLEAAEAVCAGDGVEDWEVTDLLTRLVDRSLAVFAMTGGAPRYRMLETIRAYARERLSEADELALLRERHSMWFAEMAKHVHDHAGGAEETDWLAKAALDHDNLRAALGNLNQGKGADSQKAALAMSVHLVPFWMVRGHLSEGRQWLERVLGSSADLGVGDRTAALEGVVELAFRQGDYATALTHGETVLRIKREHGDLAGEAQVLRRLGNVHTQRDALTAASEAYDRALSILRDLDDVRGCASVLNNLGNIARRRADSAAAEAFLKESLEGFRSLSDKWAMGVIFANLGDVSMDREDPAAARQHYRGSLDLARELEDKEGIAYALSGLGDAARHDGDFAAAWAAFAEGIEALRELGAQFEIADWLESMTLLMADCGRFEEAAQLLGAAEGLRQAIGAPVPETRLSALDACRVQLERQLGSARFDASFMAGGEVGWDQLSQALIDVGPPVGEGAGGPQ